jgi:prepilin-type N-terminal cleavage/methylation domain-containing protein
MNATPIKIQSASLRSFRMKGFTLLEFLVAMSMFLIVGGASLILFRDHAPYFNQQQNLAALNVAMQSTITQLQLDLVNAGTGYYAGANIPAWPVGLTVVNQNPANPCNDTTNFSYTATCFDTLNILTINPSVVPTHPTNASGTLTACSDTGTSNSFYIQPSAGLTAAQTAAQFNAGDQVILIHAGTNNNYTQWTSNSLVQSGGGQVGTFVLTGAASVTSPTVITLPHNQSNSDGTNTIANDPLNITVLTPPLTTLPTVGHQFCGSDWVLKLAPTQYTVDSTNPLDPQLTRIQAGASSVIADQIIGFKVGVTIWNDPTDPTGDSYHFNTTDYNNNFSLIRSVRVSLIGRTSPTPDAAYVFRNSFDGGPYQVLGSTVVINPRNMSMNGN